LDYLCEIVSDPGQKSRLQAMYTTTEPRAKTLQAMDPFARFVRVLLFRAANHLFDLKNEMRRFARAGDSPGAGEPVIQLVVDDQSLPEDQAAVAILQDRVEEKAQAFALASGRAYANEVLHDCLYAVFNELGSTRAQRRADFYPFPPTEPAPDAGRPAELLLDEQLEWNEVQRIQEAVESLIEDLHRGGAFDADKTDSGKGEFMWKPNAARAFRYVRKLARHEEELVTTLQRLTAATEAFKPGAPLEWLVPDPNQAELLAQQLKQRTTEVQGSDVPLPVETALAESEDHRSRVTLVAAEAYKRQVARLSELYGLAEPLLVAPSSLGGGLYLLRSSQDVPAAPGRGASGAGRWGPSRRRCARVRRRLSELRAPGPSSRAPRARQPGRRRCLATNLGCLATST